MMMIDDDDGDDEEEEKKDIHVLYIYIFPLHECNTLS